jgi:DNA (cytosine-5)-methyltransferase 1
MENVGALTFRGLDSVLSSLAEIGYDAEWCTICASDIGAPHKRERIWIVAYNGEKRKQGGREKKIQRERILPWCENGGSIKNWRKRSDLFEPKLCRTLNGIPNGIHRLECLGNSIVPQIAELIFTQDAFDEFRGIE